MPAPVLAEIADGIYATSGARQDALRQKLNQFLSEWADHIVAWDADAAVEWGKHQHSERLKRQPQSLWDSIIEAMALVRGLTVVTRNTGDFRTAQTLDPWKT